MRWILCRIGLVGFVYFAHAAAFAADVGAPALDHTFTDSVRPFLKKHCLDCHGGEEPEAALDLGTFESAADVIAEFGTWEIVIERLLLEEMPPEDAEVQPTPEERQAIVDWIRAVREHEAQRNAGDPGPVLARRLSNAEYNYTIRDLTGVDIRPASEFPVDPANEAGFDNSGESLAMTPALLTKYLDAARMVAEHLVLKPHGLDFAPHPVVTDTDRDKYCVRRIIDFYERQRTDYDDYFFAAWRYAHRAAFGEPSASLDDIAAAEGLSAKYLHTIWSILEEAEDAAGPITRLQTMWRALPPATGDENNVREECEAMRDFVVELRGKLAVEFPHLRVRGMHRGSQPLVLWRNRQYATHRRSLNRDVLVTGGEGADPDLVLPEDEAERARHLAAFEKFCATFPDKFYVSERGREFLDRDEDEVAQEKGRLLSAGFHSMMGYFRDDVPLYELLLDDDQQRELDALWQELDFIARAPIRQHKGFIWFERTDSRFMISEEFDFARAEDKDATSEAKIQRLADVYLAKAERNGGGDVELGAIEDHFENINASIRWVEEAHREAEPAHLDALLQFAERAYRRPLTAAEREDLLGFYRSLRIEGGLDHEEALRDALASVLVSPHFCYRLDIAGTGEDGEIEPLSDYALASRLSYFLWASMPDEELLAHAAAGDLHRPDVLAAQARRMLEDDRVRGLVTEFGGNWLDFRRFEEHNAVDRERFPSFTSELRQAMFEEPIRFLLDVVQNDRSVLDLLYAEHTFVNDVLAEHYGMTHLDLAPGQWLRVEDAAAYGRGGLLPMSVFLTINAPGLRTSPVKRGYWVVRRVLGEHIPAPPPNVPELPSDEAELGELTLRELLARHRQDRSCATCHEKFDSLGLVFEGFGPVGERRTEDLGGRPVETHADFPGGMEGAGVEGLREYLRERRQEEFLDNLCRKLLSYALGRTLIPSDDALVREMRTGLEEDGYRMSGVIERIVTSRQFLMTR